MVRRRAVAVCVMCAAVLGLAVPADAAVTRTGTLEAVVTDDLLTGESTTRYTLRSGGDEIVLRPTGLSAEPGDRVAVTGNVRDGRLVGAVEATSAGTEAVVAAGPRKVAVLLIAFPGDPDAPWPAQEARSEVFTAPDSANAFYREESYGAISLTGKLRADGDVFGWFDLDTPTAGCPDEAWREEAHQAAAGAGVDLTGYHDLVYMFPYKSSCSWLGMAGGDWAMINGDLFGVRDRVIVHELGHNLGLMHAGSWTCTSGGTRVQISDTCTIGEYGDPFDAMGNIAKRHNHGWNLASLGILTEQNVETVEASGAHSMKSALNPTVEPTLLRIPRTRDLDGNVTHWYHLEVRERGGVFENVTDASTTGVSIRTAAPASAGTVLLDANPATSGFGDAPLEAGQTFDGGPVRITTLSAGGGAATVSVELDEEPPTAPTGLAATQVADGVQLQWDAGSDDFGVHRYLVFRDGGQIGVTDGVGFLDPEASAGEHSYVVYAEDVMANRSAASEPATIAVVPDEEPPTAPTGLTATGGPGGVQLQWEASTDNFRVDGYLVFRDGAGIGSSTGTSFNDFFASAGAHTYVVRAHDKPGNRSGPSEPAQATLAEIEGPICAAGTCTVAFRHSGAPATWTVPQGVEGAQLTVEGAQGGAGDFPATVANRGGRVVAAVGSLTAGREVTVKVGGEGRTYAEGGAGGFGGGGDGTLGGGGWGYSSVELDSTLMLLAGGGGGWGLQGFNAVTEAEPGAGGGGNGGRFGTVGFGGGQTDAHGATLRGGAGGKSGGVGGSGGDGGTVTGTSACPGGASVGASGAAGSSFTGGGGASGAGGGGGGGHVGGGQGGGGAGDACGSTAGSGGGGGGTSFAAPGLAATFTGAARRGYGQVSIAYANPVAASKRSYLTSPDRQLVVPAASGVLAGATGPGGVPLSPSVASPPAHGALILAADGSFTYTPSSGYSGGDSFTYRVADPSGHYATAQVALTIASAPSATISAPAAAGTYALGQVVPTAFSCNEGPGGPGLASCDDSTGARTEGGGAGRLDTSTLGPHAYTVTATSKDGLTDDASIAYMVVPAPRPPDRREDPPDGPGGPSVRVKLSLGVEGESLPKLLRTGRLVVTARVNRPAEVTLSGSARLEVATRRGVRTKRVAVFRRETVRLAGPGGERVTLELSRRASELLRRLRTVRVAIVGRATDAAGGTATRKVAPTLRR